MLQDAGSDGVIFIDLLFAGAQAEEPGKQSQGQGQTLHARSPFLRLTPNYSQRFIFQAGRNPFGTSGKLLTRIPVASKSALPTAGAIAMIGVSPAPADGMSFRSRRIASISGTSRKRGTRYVAKRGFLMRPFSNSTASNSAPPRPWMIAPTT